MKMAMVLGTLMLLSGCYGIPVEGVVVDTGSRMKVDDSGGEQKFSIVLNTTVSDPSVDEIAQGPSGTVIECLSTRCATVAVGTCHRFMCKTSWRFNGPDVVACKHDKEIECTKQGSGGARGHQSNNWQGFGNGPRNASKGEPWHRSVASLRG